MPHSSPQQPAPTSAPIQPPSVRRPLPGNQIPGSRPIGALASRQPTRTARKSREPALLYPDLPETPAASGGGVTQADFWRAAFLRDLAEYRAGEALTVHWDRKSKPLQIYLIQARRHAHEEITKSFSTWTQALNGLAGNGGAA